MIDSHVSQKQEDTLVLQVRTLLDEELEQLTSASLSAIEKGGGFGWLMPPPSRIDMRNYWRGVLLVPERHVFILKYRREIVGSVQLLQMPPSNEARRYIGIVAGLFVAPWARGKRLSFALIEEMKRYARAINLLRLEIEVRQTQTRALRVYRESGFVAWAENQYYAFIDGTWVSASYLACDLGGTDSSYG